jgi:hypothetical protein
MTTLTVHDSKDYDNSMVQVDERDIPAMLNDLFETFGYDPLVKYLENYDPNQLFACIHTKNHKTVLEVQ